MKIHDVSRTLLSAMALLCLQNMPAWAGPESLGTHAAPPAVSPAPQPAGKASTRVIVNNGADVRSSAILPADHLHAASADYKSSSTRARDNLGVDASALG